MAVLAAGSTNGPAAGLDVDSVAESWANSRRHTKGKTGRNTRNLWAEAEKRLGGAQHFVVFDDEKEGATAAGGTAMPHGDDILRYSRKFRSPTSSN